MNDIFQNRYIEHQDRKKRTLEIEDGEDVKRIKEKVNSEFVPKIETIKGVENIHEIAKIVETVMLDKEDLYIDCGGKNYEQLIKEVKSANVRVLELIGVIFK